MEPTTIPIKHWHEDDRPREKLLAKGPAALTKAELLAILINTGTAKRSAIDLAKDILALAENNLHQLGRLSVHDLMQVKGIGEAKAITIAAALELGRLRQMSAALERPTITSHEAAAEILLPMLMDKAHEEFVVLYLNQAGKLLECKLLSSGGLTGTVADVRMILREALLINANQLIVAHNHPSGNLTPSAADKVLTQKIQEAARHMDIRLLDHLIIAGNRYLSLADEGIMVAKSLSRK